MRPLNRLKLPKSEDDWKLADAYFASVLVPQVCCECDVDIANDVLVSSIYQYFCQKFGVVSTSGKRKRRSSTLAQQLLKAKREKRMAQRSLRRAKKRRT